MFKIISITLALVVTFVASGELRKNVGKPAIKKQVTTKFKSKNSGINVTLKRATQFSEWNNVKKKIRDKTFLTILNEPKPEDVKNVVFISAGQQAPDPRNQANTVNGYPNVLTGQHRHYKASCSPQCTKKIKQDSLAGRIYKSSRFPKSNTLMVLVFDSQFNHFKSDKVKASIKNAIWKLLTSRFYSGRVKKIILSGQSKGGCISFGLAKRFRSTTEYAKIPLIVQGFDPVCKNGQLLAQGRKSFFNNPRVSHHSFKSMFVNMGLYFPVAQRNNLAFLNIHSGAPVLDIGPLKAVHSFTYKPNNVDLGWWKQTWVSYGHTDMGGNMRHANHTVIPGFNHILKYSNKFNAYQPPGGGIINSNAKKCSFPFPIEVASHNGRPVCTAKLARKISTKKCSKQKGMQLQSKYCIWGKKKYWHARPLKVKDKSFKCVGLFPRTVGSYQSKPLCMALAPAKISSRKCNKKKGMKYNGYCLWGKNKFWHARPIRGVSGGGSTSSGSASSGTSRGCPKRHPTNLGTYSGKPVCSAKLPRKIKSNKCNNKGGRSWKDSFCLLNKNDHWKARPFK